MEDIGMGAFSVFFTQSPSFLARQKSMRQAKGKSNAQSLFHLEQIPCDNHIRQSLDHVPPEMLHPCYDEVFESLRQAGHLESRRVLQGTLLLALDGTWYHSSQKIHCRNCSCLEHKSGDKTHYHSAVTPVIVAPGQEHAIPLRPEFITPQDGHTKQDCELAASKRWLENNAARYAPLEATLLGDDLYAHQPFCRQTLLHGFHFIFVCKPDSHTTLYHWVNLLQRPELGTVKSRVKVGAHFHTFDYRYANDVPLAEGADALKVNWCEVTVTDHKDQVIYRNGFITDFKITPQNVDALVAAGRARWKIENENNNTLKTKGYHLEHNFGHGKEHLSSLLAAMNILAFLYHTFLSFSDERYRLIRAALPSRKTFFDDLRALTRYLLFPNWDALMDFMMRGLEIGPYANAP
ncbi:MAG: ISNCY family transposase [Bryobacteraceae bacterium]